MKKWKKKLKFQKNFKTLQKISIFLENLKKIQIEKFQQIQKKFKIFKKVQKNQNFRKKLKKFKEKFSNKCLELSKCLKILKNQEFENRSKRSPKKNKRRGPLLDHAAGGW